jgi:hypothetical protein
VTNTGQADQEFVVGGREVQATAEEERSDGVHRHSAAMAALTLALGETRR